MNTSKELTKTNDENIGATESRLLQAMSIDDSQTTTSADVILPEFKAYAGEKLSEKQIKAQLTEVIEAIRTVSDPEIPINVYDMGLIYKINQHDNGDLFIDMTLTSPTCPIAGVLPQQVADAVADVKGVGAVEVKLVWEPVWTPDRLTEEAKEMLELL